MRIRTTNLALRCLALTLFSLSFAHASETVLTPTDDNHNSSFDGAKVFVYSSDYEYTFMRFDVSSILNVQKATLRLYYDTLFRPSVGDIIVGEASTDDWSEFGDLPETNRLLRFDSAQQLADPATTPSNHQGWVEIDLTDYVVTQVNTDGIVSLVIQVTGSSDYRAIHSKENRSGNAPQLVIDSGDFIPPDFDGDGIPDDQDSDDDNDGVLDNQDAFPFDNTESIDTDGDGIGDNSDPTPNGELPNQPPVASFTLTPNTGIARFSVRTIANASYDPDGSIETLIWDFGDGRTATENYLANSGGRFTAYDSPGTYTITLTVVDNDGASTSTSQTLVVNPVPPSSIPRSQAISAFAAISSSEINGSPAKNVIDASLATEWTTPLKQGGSEWIYLDLGDEYVLDQVVFQWSYGGHPSDYSLQTSSDGIAWTDLLTGLTPPDPLDGPDIVSLSGTKSRYLRMLSSVSVNGETIGLADYQVYGRTQTSDDNIILEPTDDTHYSTTVGGKVYIYASEYEYAFLRFDVSQIQNVEQATLRVYYDTLFRASNGFVYVGEASTDNWSENGNIPDRNFMLRFDANLQLATPVATPASHQGWINIDLSDYVAAQAGGDGIVSLVLQIDGSSDYRGIHSKENLSGNSPELVINTTAPDFDQDGIPDDQDPDDDNDGVDDSEDTFPFDNTETSDNDNDGTGDNADLDDDNDGVADLDDAFPFDATETNDSDQDGIGDNSDPTPNGETENSIVTLIPTDDTHYSTTVGGKAFVYSSDYEYTFLRFDVSQIRNVRQARLRIYYDNRHRAISGLAYVGEASTDDWSENGNIPEKSPFLRFDSNLQIATPVATPASHRDWIEIDVSDYVAAQANGDDIVSLVLQITGDSSWLGIHSKENLSGNAPELVIQTSGQSNSALEDCILNGVVVDSVANQAECNALVKIFENNIAPAGIIPAPGNPSSTGWHEYQTAPRDPCGWIGVSCDSDGISSLIFDATNDYIQITGTLPSEIGDLDNLTRLIIFNRSISGAIPRSLSNLNNLDTLALTSNQLSGEIPAELGNLTNLKSLFLSNNELSGDITTAMNGLIDTLLNMNLNGNNCLTITDQSTVRVVTELDPNWNNGCDSGTSSTTIATPAQVLRLDQFRSEITGDPLLLQMYLPENYDPNVAYPIMYVMDDIAPRFATHVNAGKHQVILAMVNGWVRTRDFTSLGASTAYDVLTTEVLPLIESQYTVDPHQRSIAGWSLSGLFAGLVLLLEDPNDRKFRNYIALDGSFWSNKNYTNGLIRQLANVTNTVPASLYLSGAGSDGNDPDVQYFRDALAAQNFNQLNIDYVPYPYQGHGGTIDPYSERVINALYPTGAQQ